MSDQAVRQRYRLGTGGGLTPEAPRTPGKPGFQKGGAVKKQAGGSCYSKGGSSPKKR